MSTACKHELENFLSQSTQKECAVVVAPDFFLDRLINLPWTASEFSGLVAKVTLRKGGSLDGIPQSDLKGGNAINVASALARLGVSVTPIVCTSHHGLERIRYYFKHNPINLDHIKIREKASITTALEFNEQEGKTNVMLRELGSLADFGPIDLEESDYELLETADYVCLFNWAGTLRHGTELAESVFGRAKRGRAKTFCDTADPTPNRHGIADLIANVLKTSKIDILSLNENEAVTYASFLDSEFASKRMRLGVAELAMDAARILAAHFSARIDLHTTAFSASIKGGSEVVVPTFKVKALRATGAGDSWCAGNLLGDHSNLSDECRLMLANAVSACYLSGEDGMHATKEKLLGFLKAQV
ncbi:MAG: carbohydrate kinase family protein [Candidatus Bathyarchaeota archaeon]|nr:carbohydrate kinase family protein [Candidatus Bathyarchaeota archaeon]